MTIWKAVCALLPILAWPAAMAAQDASFPLESISVEGAAASKAAVTGIAGFHIGTPVNKTSIEEACRKLQESGLFAAVGYGYAPGPKRGYAVTLKIEDHSSLIDATIDIPGVDETEVWQFLAASFPAFRRKVPGLEAAQQFLERQMEQHLGAKLDGQRLTTRIEVDFASGKTIVSFQPENLPSIAALQFEGQKEISAQELGAILSKVTGSFGYTDRRFRDLVERNLRPAYEDRGMYRVKFSGFAMQKIAPGVTVTTGIDEGPKFKLGEVRFTGDSLPERAMRGAGNFKTGNLARWAAIQESIWEAEKALKRSGYLAASTRPERILRDDTRVLDLNLVCNKGPLHHFGQLHITGLAPDLEARVRRTWRMQPGDPFDYMYANDFLREFSKNVDFRQFKKYDVKMEKGAGEHVMDLVFLFETK